MAQSGGRKNTTAYRRGMDRQNLRFILYRIAGGYDLLDGLLRSNQGVKHFCSRRNLTR